MWRPLPPSHVPPAVASVTPRTSTPPLEVTHEWFLPVLLAMHGWFLTVSDYTGLKTSEQSLLISFMRLKFRSDWPLLLNLNVMLWVKFIILLGIYITDHCWVSTSYVFWWFWIYNQRREVWNMKWNESKLFTLKLWRKKFVRNLFSVLILIFNSQVDLYVRQKMRLSFLKKA